MAKFKFKTRMDAYHAIRLAAGKGETTTKNKMIAAAHKKWPPKK